MKTKKLKLGKHKARRKWRGTITHGGKEITKYFDIGSGWTDKEAYSAALQAWQTFVETLPTEPEILTLTLPNDTAERLAVMRGMMDTLQKSKELDAAGIPYKVINVPVNQSSDNGVGVWVDKFTDDKLQEAKKGTISLVRYVKINNVLGKFKTWFIEQGKSDVSEINGLVLSDYKRHLGATVGDWHEKSSLQIVKQFIEACMLDEGIPYSPALILKIKNLKSKVTLKKVELFSDEQIKTVLDSVEGRTRLFVLLALNCGMTQIDISDLKQKEVDWKKGRISRKRSKGEIREAGKSNSVPEVDYKLWPATFKLLKQFRSSDPERALLNNNGKPLVNVYFKDGLPTKTDSVLLIWNALKKRLGEEFPTFGKLKKVSNTKLANSERFSHLCDEFLGHAGGSMTKRHYTGKINLDDGLDWLAAEYGIK